MYDDRGKLLFNAETGVRLIIGNSEVVGSLFTVLPLQVEREEGWFRAIFCCRAQLSRVRVAVVDRWF